MSNVVLPRPLLEIAVASLGDCLTAVNAGADRLELNQFLACGGLTPSPGLFLEVRRQVGLPLFVMLRPRAGGFIYPEADFAVMERDLDFFLVNGADGFVVGLVTEHGEVDEARCRSLIQRASGKPLVFHRAFDMLKRPMIALERLIDLGFQRVLTSGQEKTAWEGVTVLRQLNEQAHGRIEVLPGSGVKPENAAGILRASGCSQVHASCRRRVSDPSLAQHRWLELGAPEADQYEETDAGQVQALRRTLDRYYEMISGTRTES